MAVKREQTRECEQYEDNIVDKLLSGPRVSWGLWGVSSRITTCRPWIPGSKEHTLFI